MQISYTDQIKDQMVNQKYQSAAQIRYTNQLHRSDQSSKDEIRNHWRILGGFWTNGRWGTF